MTDKHARFLEAAQELCAAADEWGGIEMLPNEPPETLRARVDASYERLTAAARSFALADEELDE